MTAAVAKRGYRFFKVVGYRTKLSSARNAVGYAAFRSEAVQGKGALIFDARTDSADTKAFMKSLDDPVTRNPKFAKAFHCLFSLPTETYDRHGVEWREVVREVLGSYELQTRRKLEWIAVQHDDPKHKHAHVIIKATYTDPAGRVRKLTLRKPELEAIKDSVAKALEARGLNPDRPYPQRTHDRPDTRWATAAVLAMKWVDDSIKGAQRRQKERDRETELEIQQALERKRRDRGGR